MYKFILTILLNVSLCLSFTINLQAQIINIPDSNFKNVLLLTDTLTFYAKDSMDVFIKIDINNDREIQYSEALRVNKLFLPSANIVSIEGIQYFYNLQELYCNDNRLKNLTIAGLNRLNKVICDNNQLVSLNFNNLPELNFLNCSYNQLSSISLNNTPGLTELRCNQNLLTVFNISNLPLLQKLDCSYNLINSLDLRSFNALKFMYCYNNKIINLNVTGLTNLIVIECEDNFLPSLTLGSVTNLRSLKCYNNKLTSLNLNGLTELYELNCSRNLLTSLYIKNGVDNSSIITNGNYAFSLNPDLRSICVDASDKNGVYYRTALSGYDSSIVNTLCNSTINATYYTLNGNVKYDNNLNGCNSFDPNFTNMKIKIKNLSDSGYTISNIHGDYIFHINSGSYTITPQLPNNYFACTPAFTTVTFPEDTIPQQFCITPNGIHHDVSVTIIPLRAARPGFSDATYRIILKNNGNQIENGTILFSYDEDKQDYISSTITPNNIASGELTFNFNNLQLFEIREITVTMRTNAPTDNPAVNVDDVLGLSVASNLNNSVIDEYLADNFHAIKQTVVGSFDPNDKTCLEGEIITPVLVGDFVNYLIRFENTGTANAENIVVTDFIDLAKFDITTLQITSTSHSCKTLISNGNKVQFVFDNINLPFTEPLKHGYVAFKIKTKNNLAIGDSLKNKADIYFDYNLPITTNTATSRITTITGINTNTLQNGSLSIYPNPANEQFTINFESPVRQAITLKIIGKDGNVVYEQNTSHINKSQFQLHPNLPGGIYLISITGNKQQYVQKFIVVK